MFTGLIEGIGEVKDIRRMGEDMILTITPTFDFKDCRVGESVCVEGVCLTVTGIREGSFAMDASGETLSRTTLGSLRRGQEVNLERALRLADRLGGHLVSGHVDGIGRILKKEPQRRSWVIRIGLEEHLTRYVIEKGSIAVDGVSLTINHCDEASFEVNIIPQTSKETTLMKKRVGDPVNIETDLIGKYVEKFFLRDTSKHQEKPSRIDMEMLIRQGFGD
jgi:riboflavin synthase